MTTDKLPWLPHAIYYDANALIAIPHTLHDPSFEAVVAFTRDHHIELVLPEVAFYEWLHSLAAKLEVRLARIEDDAKYVASLLDRPMLDYRKPDTKKVTAEFMDKHEERVKAAGVQIAATPMLEINQLLVEAVLKVLPFQSGGKGFRDAVIVETAAQHAAGKYDNPRILLISNDKAVQQSERRFKDKGIVAVICSAEKALGVLHDSWTEAFKTNLALLEKAALEFLLEHQDSVFEFITTSEIGLSGLESMMREVRPTGFPRIRRLDAVRPIKIVSASPGIPSLGVQLPPDRFSFPFDVEVEFDLTIEYPFGGTIIDRRSIPLSRPVSIEEVPQPSPLVREPALETMTMTCDIRVVATVSSEGAEDLSYKDLQMTEIYPWRAEKCNPFLQQW